MLPTRIIQAKRQPETLGNISSDFIENFLKNGNIVALKIIYYIAQISIKEQYKDELFFRFKIRENDIKEFCNFGDKAIERNIKKMVETSITIYDKEQNSVKFVPLFTEAAIYLGIKEVEFEIKKEIYELIKGKIKPYITLDVKEIGVLTSIHTIRFLPILHLINDYKKPIRDENNNITRYIPLPKVQEYTIDELNGIFDTNYKRTGSFVANILNKIKQELEETNNPLSFEFQTIYDKDKRFGRSKGIKIRIEVIDNAKLKQTNEELKMKKYLEEKKAINNEHEQQGQLGIV